MEAYGWVAREGDGRRDGSIVVCIAGTHHVTERVKEKKGLARVTGRGSDNKSCEDEEMERRRRRWNLIDTKRIVDKAGRI